MVLACSSQVAQTWLTSQKMWAVMGANSLFCCHRLLLLQCLKEVCHEQLIRRSQPCNFVPQLRKLLTGRYGDPLKAAVPR